MQGLLSVDVAQLVFQPGDTPLDDTAVGLDLGLAWATHTDTTLLTFEVGPHTGQAGKQVLVLGKLHLGLGRRRLRALGEDVENQARPVENLDLQLLLYVGNLLCREVIVENHHSDVVLLDIFLYFLQLAFADESRGVGGVDLLGEALDHLAPRRVGQELKFVEIFIDLPFGLARGNQPNDHGPFGGFLRDY